MYCESWTALTGVSCPLPSTTHWHPQHQRSTTLVRRGGSIDTVAALIEESECYADRKKKGSAKTVQDGDGAETGLEDLMLQFRGKDDIEKTKEKEQLLNLVNKTHQELRR